MATISKLVALRRNAPCLAHHKKTASLDAVFCKRSTNHTYHQMRLPFILAFPVSSSTAATP
ncbi:hypothetical protein, partial [Pseudomonas syringae group genomosp. 3]|uniref:hypothetical protein n=1 Tax=Pseudomonas syringae group genomosp. 3 TaxID=251701 RepID=UPI001EE48E64